MTAERTALRTSIAISAVLALVGVTWGIVSGSQIILLDGLFSVVGIATSWMLLRASALSASGPKLGRKLYVEVEAQADPALTIADEHAMRDELRSRLAALPYGIWLNFELHPRTPPGADAA